MKKILIISPMNLPIPAVKGGAVETLVENILNENENNRNLKISVVRVGEKVKKDYEMCDFITINGNKFITFFDRLLNFFVKKIMKKEDFNLFLKLYFLNRIKKEMILKDYDAVIIENQAFITHVYNNKKIVKKYKGKIYYHLHNDVSPRSNKNLMLNENKILISNYLKKNIENTFGEESLKNTYILYNGIRIDNENAIVSNEERKKIRKRFGFSEDDIVISFVGRIAKEKGVYELLEAIDKIDNPKLKLMIIGSVEFGKSKTSDFESKVIKKVKMIGNKVVLTGFIPNAELYKYYQSSDFAVLPSIWEEPAGLTMIEATLNKLYVITTDSGGIPEYIKNSFAKIIKKDDDIVESIREAIENTLQSGIYKNRNDYGADYIKQNFSSEVFYKKFCDIFIKKEKEYEKK